MRRIRRMLALALAGICIGGQAVAAEETSESEDPVVEEILVTALKREASVLDTPAAISALGAEDLRDRGIQNVSDVQYLVPSMHYGENLGRRNISIRGVGEFAYAPGVMVSVDGVVQAIGTSSQLPQLDLERVEVLRGPQGTLYGRNATGGAVNFIAAKPTDELEGSFKAGYADFRQFSVEGVLSGPLTDRVGIRVAANRLDQREGWIENLQPGEPDQVHGTKTNMRAILTAELSDTLSAEFTYGRSEMEGPWDHWTIIREHFALGVASGLPPNAIYTEEPRKVYTSGPSDSDRVYQMYNLTLDWDLPAFSVKSITAYQDWQDFFVFGADATHLGLFDREDDGMNETWTQEITLSGQNGGLDWVAGLYYMDDERARHNFFDFPVPALLPLPFPPQIDIYEPFYNTESRAVFADATYSVSDRWRFGFGVRRTEEEKEEGHTFTILAKFPFGPVPLVQRCGPTLLVQKWDESDTTVRASAEYDISDTGMVYVSYSEGFKVGGVNTSDCNPPWNPETVDAWEIGYKASFFEGATSLRMAAFQYDYSDFQVAQVIGIQGFISNAGDAEIDGLEVELTSRLNEHWRINAAVTLLDSAYGHFLNTDTLRRELGLLQNRGNPLNNAPERSVNLGIAYETPFANVGRLVVSVDASMRSRVYYREFGNKDDSQGAYTIVNLNLNWFSPDERWSARLFMRNATDEEYVTQLVGSNTTYGRQGTWNMPRQAGFEITRFFGAR